MIGSSTVESGRKQTVTQRLKRSGARWTKHRGRMTAKARAAYLSEQLDELSRFRAPMAKCPTTFECTLWATQAGWLKSAN